MGARLVLASERVHINGTAGRAGSPPAGKFETSQGEVCRGLCFNISARPPCRPLADSLCSRRLTFSQARKRSRGSTSSKGLGLREVSMEGYDKRTNKCSRVGICRCIYHVILLLSFHWSNFESQAKYLAITSVSILRQ